MNRQRDIRMKSTSVGPHRDDVCFMVGNLDIRRFGSQGQQRTAALSLKLAEIELVKRVIGDTPVLLLDDVLSELDKHRQNYLLDSIHDIQTLITCTGVDEFVNHRFEVNKVFHVQNGQVIKENLGGLAWLQKGTARIWRRRNSDTGRTGSCKKASGNVYWKYLIKRSSSSGI